MRDHKYCRLRDDSELGLVGCWWSGSSRGDRNCRLHRFDGEQSESDRHVSVTWGSLDRTNGDFMKHALVAVGVVAVLVGLAGLLLGNTSHPILPGAVANQLDPQKGLGLLAVGGGALYIGFR